MIVNLSVAADCFRTVDEIEDRGDAVRVRCAQRVDHLDGFGVVDFFGTEAATLTSGSVRAWACNSPGLLDFISRLMVAWSTSGAPWMPRAKSSTFWSKPDATSGRRPN